MEKMATSVEGVCREANVSRLSGSKLMRTGLSIDPNFSLPVMVNEGDCQNFSIRHYVAEMRKKDMRICSPFGSSSNPLEKLPPLDIPEHKWWRCANCIRKIGADERVGLNVGDASMNIGSTNFVFKAGVRVEENGNPSTEVIFSKQCSNQEIETNHPVVNLSDNSTNIEPIPSNDGNDKVVPCERRCADGRGSRTDSKKGKDSQNGQRIASNTLDQIKELDSKEKVVNMSNMKLCQSPSLGLRKGNNQTSQGGDVNLAENSWCDLHEDIGNDLKHCKTPKMRLMCDFLSGEVNLERSCVNEDLFSANTMPMEPDATVSPMDKGINISQKKRNISQEDGCRRRKKHKEQAQVVGGCSLEIPLEGKICGLGTNGSDANILIRSSHAFPSRNNVQHQLRNNNELLHEKEGGFDLSKLLEVRQATSHINVAPDKNFQKRNLSKEKYYVQMPIGIGMVTSQPEKELSFKEKLDQNLRSFRGAQKHVENDTIQSKGTTNCPLTLHKGNKSCDPLRSNVVESGQSSRKEEIDLKKKIDFNQWQISPSMLQWRNLQIHPMENPRPNNNINLNKVHAHSYLTIQRNQQSMKFMERGPSIYVPPMGIVDMSKNQHERIHPQTQNRVLPWSNPLSTSFRPLCANGNANFGLLKDGTAMVQQQFKLSNVALTSASVSTGWGLQHGIWLPVLQNLAFRPNNPQNYHNQEKHKRGQVAPGLLQKGRTISDIKTMDFKRAEHMRTKGIRSLNPFSSEGMSATQLLRYQERPSFPCNIRPPFCMDRNPSIFNGLFLSHQQSKESSGVYMDGFTVGQNSRKHVSYIKDQVVSLGSQVKKRKAHAPTQLGRRKFQQSASSSGLPCITRYSGPKLVDPIQDDNVSKSLGVGGCSVPVAILPFSGISKKDPACLFNQNPVDIADTNDERYFRTVEDQRIRDKSSLGEKFGVVKMDGIQRHRRKEMIGRMSVSDLKSKFL